jgi:peptidoglycan lytic transglycosylase B
VKAFARIRNRSSYALLITLGLAACAASPSDCQLNVPATPAQSAPKAPVLGCDQNAPATPPAQVVAPAPAPAPIVQATPPQPTAFLLWVADFKREALAKGIDPQVLEAAFAHVTQPLQAVIERDQTQPEAKKTFDDYIKGVLKPHRIDAAREQWASHEKVLAQVHDAYRVPVPVLLALWQSESAFGKVQGNFNIIEALATLAYDGRRSAFFRKELLNALMILQQEHMSASGLVGSWAGAMGQVQFIPSSFLAFAVDFDGDALASMANYLKTKGWDDSIGWGFHVRVPKGAKPVSWAHDKAWHSFKEWRKLGVKRAGGGRLPADAYQTRLAMPDDDPDNAYLVTENYDVIMDWNHSIYFATSVGLLADAIANGGPK